jgi:hypothetical protein
MEPTRQDVVTLKALITRLVRGCHKSQLPMVLQRDIKIQGNIWPAAHYRYHAAGFLKEGIVLGTAIAFWHNHGGEFR